MMFPNPVPLTPPENDPEAPSLEDQRLFIDVECIRHLSQRGGLVYLKGTNRAQMKAYEAHLDNIAGLRTFAPGEPW